MSLLFLHCLFTREHHPRSTFLLDCDICGHEVNITYEIVVLHAKFVWGVGVVDANTIEGKPHTLCGGAHSLTVGIHQLFQHGVAFDFEANFGSILWITWCAWKRNSEPYRIDHSQIEIGFGFRRDCLGHSTRRAVVLVKSN